VLLSITADIGSVGLARQEQDGAYVSQHLALLSPGDRCSGEWLAHALSTSDAQRQLDSARYGGTKTQLGLEDVADIAIPLPSREAQEDILRQVRATVRSADAVEHPLETQISLLRERRQALITAAVTGELDLAAHAA
jgi:type I restriction enzyme S subunit